MSRVLTRLQSNDEVDIIWRFCLFVAFCILIGAILIFIQTIQHLHCIPNPASSTDFNSKIELRNVNIYSTLSVTCASLTVIAAFSVHLVCTQWSCLENGLGIIYAFLFWNSYIFAKIFLYLIFEGRLFNPHYRQIYQYPQYIRCVLWILLFILIITLIGFNIEFGLDLEHVQYDDIYAMDSGLTAIYATTDIIISLLTMTLFFCPLYHHSRRPSTTTAMYVLKKYGILSALQLFVALSFQFSLLVGTILDTVDASLITLQKVNIINRTIQMLDCLLLMFCIYFGFARKQTVCMMNIWAFILIPLEMCAHLFYMYRFNQYVLWIHVHVHHRAD